MAGEREGLILLILWFGVLNFLVGEWWWCGAERLI